MSIYIEMIILYVILFFSGSTGLTTSAGPEGFSVTTGLAGIFLYSIPSLALIWYLLLRIRKIRDWDILPGKKDLISCLISFPCLLITGFLIARISSYIGGTAAQVTLYSPVTVMEWIVLCFSCISAAYLEESFFRFYILSRRDELQLSTTPAVVLSIALFSICHIYEGPWGFLNSAVSGAFLAFIFLRYKSLHGIAIAHSLYNIAVYAINAKI